VKKSALLSRLALLALLSAANPAWAATTNVTGTNTAQVTLNSGDALNVSATGTLTVNTSGKDAVLVKGNATISNLGVILQTGTGASNGARAIRDNTGTLTLSITNGSLTNSYALVEAYDSDAIQMNKPGSTVTIYNYGRFISRNDSAGGSQAIDFNALNTTAGSNTVYNYFSGLLQAANADSVRPGVNGIIYNSGTIKATTTNGSSSDGIDAQNNTGIQISNDSSLTTGSGATNLIEGARHGITGGAVDNTSTFTMSITNNANGTIQGDNGSGINLDGFNALEQVTIVNSGTITGNGTSLTGTETTHDGDGVDVDGVVNLTNSGTIRSINALGDTSEGVTVGGGTITNSGTIQGSVTSAGIASGAVGRGMTLAGIDTGTSVERIYANTTVTNSGLIKGDTNAGIAVLGVTGTLFSVTITNTLGGTIKGGGTAVAAIDGSAALTLNGTGTASSNNESIINYGLIDGSSSGKAISLGSGNNSVQIVGPSASVLGNMSGGTITGTNSLSIDPTAGGTFTYTGVISNFGSVDIKSGTVTFSGANIYNGTTSIEGVLNLTGSGTIGTTTTLTISNTGTFNLGGGTVTVGNLANSGKINNGTVTTSGTGTVSGLSGSTGFNKNSAGTTTIAGTNTYTGGTTVTQGKLAVDGSITSNVNVNSGAELGGHGIVGGTISGTGKVGPGNSPGILTASATDPSGGLSYNFEFTLAGVPTWNNASNSGNDVLHLTAALPFTTAMTSANTFNLYFSALSTTYEGGFFTDGPTNNLSSNLANALYNYYLLDNTNGTVIYNGNKYDLINGQVLAGTTQITGANFGTGTTNGWTETFYVSPTAIPEPSTYLMIGIGMLVLLVVARKRRMGRD